MGALVIAIAAILSCDLDQSRQVSNDECDAVRRMVATSFSRWNSLFVEYDLFVVEDNGIRDHKLTVIEAIDPSHHFSQSIHWYIRSLYDFDGRPTLDPLLNSLLWTPQGRLHLWQTERQANVFAGELVELTAPLLQLFSSYLGKMSPQQRIANTSDDTYSAKEFYLPMALELPGWIAVQGEMHEMVLCRRTDHVSDELTIDKNLNYTVTSRDVRWNDSSKYLKIVGEGFREVMPSLWLPTNIRIFDKHPYMLELHATKMSVTEIPAACFSASLPSGTIVRDGRTNKTGVVPGGEEFLDFTVERMSLVAKHTKKDGAAMSVEAVVFVMLGCISAVMTVVALRRWQRIKVKGAS